MKFFKNLLNNIVLNIYSNITINIIHHIFGYGIWYYLIEINSALI